MYNCQIASHLGPECSITRLHICRSSAQQVRTYKNKGKASIYLCGNKTCSSNNNIHLLLFHFPRCVHVEQDPSFHEAVYPLKRLETAFTESHYYLHMIAFQDEGMGGRRSIKQTNTSLVSALNLQTDSSWYEQYLLLARGWANDYRSQSLRPPRSCKNSFKYEAILLGLPVLLQNSAIIAVKMPSKAPIRLH